MIRRSKKSESEITKLTEALARCPHVRHMDERGEKTAASIAYCFDSLEDYFREFLENQLPRLTQGKLTDQEVCDLLYDIGATLGQIVWHIRLPKFYRYLEDQIDPTQHQTQINS